MLVLRAERYWVRLSRGSLSTQGPRTRRGRAGAGWLLVARIRLDQLPHGGGVGQLATSGDRQEEPRQGRPLPAQAGIVPGRQGRSAERRAAGAPRSDESS